MRKPILYIALMGVTLGAASCAPRVVTKITGNAEQMKLVYEQRSYFGPKTGIVKCKVAPGGALKECANMALEFKE